MTPDLVTVSAVAFAAVVALLGVLAGVIHLLGVLFPERAGEDDDAVVAAIHAVVSTAYPGMRATRIEETR
jgi:hypothetical protein